MTCVCRAAADYCCGLHNDSVGFTLSGDDSWDKKDVQLHR